ncbi:hypothetical protein OHB35_28590 [Streptomyces phaeochromogenes]|uniref:Uncharacterized protein n=1 Tax=Streptomyces phaeochromogenes TaxID=1923 RepID=A0ABZ1HE71_STRPH|nr:hypothetical protein [Streptomyces phaeochromogenes]WSD16888.1 hypothetical protein OHB35_28590 [Streptomyces phaeochromogenes]
MAHRLYLHRDRALRGIRNDESSNAPSEAAREWAEPIPPAVHAWELQPGEYRIHTR